MVFEIEAGIERPVMCIRSAGSDPTCLVEKAATKPKNLNLVSMGQGREEFAKFILHNQQLKKCFTSELPFRSLRMDVFFEIYKADAREAKKEQNKETKAADATKKIADTDKVL
jgi:hypothetical protein